MNNPFRGAYGAHTASFYRLDKRGQPIEYISDLIPKQTDNRIKLDMIDSEAVPHSYVVTGHPLEDLQTASSNIYKELRVVQLTGTLISSTSLGVLGSFGLGNLPGSSTPLRPDLAAMELLIRLADAREPIMYASPRTTLPVAFIEEISDPWDPSVGENTIVTILLKEARIVQPLDALSVAADIEASLTGNNAETTGSVGDVESFALTTTSPVPGVAPQVIPI